MTTVPLSSFLRRGVLCGALVAAVSVCGAEEAPIVAAPAASPAASKAPAEDSDSLGDFASEVERLASARGASEVEAVPATPPGGVWPVSGPAPEAQPVPHAAPPLQPPVAAQPKELPPSDEVATGDSLVPSQPEAPSLVFANTAAGEVVVRLSVEYRVPIVYSGDGSIPVTGSFARTADLEPVLASIFPPPRWVVGREGGTYLVTDLPALYFRKLSISDLKKAP